MATPRILSGIKPTGRLHIGNYFGMMRPAIEWQERGEAFYFIADYHALTTVHDAAALREYTRGVALDFLACGLDPAKRGPLPPERRAARTRNSRGSSAASRRCRCWRIATPTRTTSRRAMTPSHGLFAYPVLMAADILIYDSDIVPVAGTRSSTSR